MLTENILEERNQVRTISDNGITLVEERIGVFRKKKKAQMKVLRYRIMSSIGTAKYVGSSKSVLIV